MSTGATLPSAIGSFPQVSITDISFLDLPADILFGLILELFPFRVLCGSVISSAFDDFPDLYLGHDANESEDDDCCNFDPDASGYGIWPAIVEREDVVVEVCEKSVHSFA